MKNAYVTDHHYGDDGAVDVGMILVDVTQKRFDALEKAGLVREATADEVKAGYKPPFAPDDSAEPNDEKKKPEHANKKAVDSANKGA